MAISAIHSSELIQHASTGGPAPSAHGQETGRVDGQQPSFTTNLSNHGQTRAAIDRLQSAAAELSGAAFAAHVAASSNPPVVSANPASKVSGALKIDVLQVAKAQTLVTSPLASPNTFIGSGEKAALSVQFGSSNGAAFTADIARAAKKITIDTGNNTLHGVAAAVNAADAGVVAAVSSDGKDHQLQITAKETGSENSFTLTLSGDETLKSYLSYTPEKTPQSVTRTVEAQDAQVKVNDVSVTSSSNTVSNAADGVTLQLKSTGSAQISAGDNQDHVIAQKVSNFLNAYNELQAQLKQADTGDAPAPPVAHNLKARVTFALDEANRNADALGGLAGIGIRPDAAGNLKLDSPAFQTALGVDREAVAKIFTNDGAGFADLYSAVAHDLSKVAGREAPHLSDAARSEQTRQSQPASGISLQASGFENQYSQLTGLVQAVKQTDQTLNGLLLQGDAAQSSQSTLLNRLNSIANIATP